MRIQNLLKPLSYGILLTIVLNLIIYLIGTIFTIIDNGESQKSGNSLTISTVILYNSIIPIVASVISLLLLYKLLNNPLLVFKILGGVALLFPVIMDIAKPDSSVAFKIISILMLLVPAGAVGYFLLGLFDKPGSIKAL